MPLGLLDQVGGQYRGPIELTGFDAQPDLHELGESRAVRTLGEAEPFDPVCHLRQLGLGAGEVAVHEARKARCSSAVAMGSLTRTTPRRSRCWPAAARPDMACFEAGTGGVELAAMPRHHTDEASITGRNHVRPPLRPARNVSSTSTTRRRSARVK